jgi:hypothetical protein
VKLDLVAAVGQQQRAGRAPDTAADDGQRVERRLVGPVQVLHHEHGRVAAVELVEQRAEHRLARCVGGQRVGELAARLPGDVVDRPQRTRREQRVAGAPQEARAAGARDALCQRGLADPGLAGDQHDAAVAGPRLCQHLLKRPDGGITLQQLHRPTSVGHRTGTWPLSGHYMRMPTVPGWLALGGGGHEGTNPDTRSDTASAVAHARRQE